MTSGDWESVSPREGAVLDRVERRLTNAEIAGELFISVRTVESHIAALRRKLGVGTRAELIAEARGRRRGAVPLPQNSFIGRSSESEALRDLLASRRFVTVVGAGGCGKSRLAREVVALDGRMPVVVDLERATDALDALAAELGLVVDRRADRFAAVSVALDAEPTLLLLDNGDPVRTELPTLVDRLLAASRSLVVLATSRASLGGSDETIFELDPLDTTPAGAIPDAASRLFLDRAAAAAPAQPLTAADAPTVSAIMRRLDGLPLVIEIAAARLRHLTVADLAERLEDGFGWLDRAGSASRHRTLEAAFEWTWDQLEASERDALSRLAALPEPFGMDLARAVTDISAVLQLADRSLVTRQRETGRHRLLGTLRVCVLGRTGPRVVREVRAKHAAWVLGIVEPLAARARADDRPETNRAATGLYADAAAAIDFALGNDDAQLALRLARSVAVLLEQYGLRTDGRDAVARAASSQAVRDVAGTEDLFLLGQALCYGDLTLVDELAGVALARTGDAQWLSALHLAGTVDAYLDRALDHLDAAEELAVAAEDHWALGSIRQHRGIALRRPSTPGAAPDPERALAAFESALESYALAGDAMHVNNTRYMMASTAAELGLVDRAIQWADQCADYARYTGNEHELAHAVLARLTASGDTGAELDGIIQTFRSVGDLRCLTRSYFLAAGRAGNERAACGLALEIARRAGDAAGQARALERLIVAGDDRNRESARAFGALTVLLGEDVAAARLPHLSWDGLEVAVLEGRAAEVARRG